MNAPEIGIARADAVRQAVAAQGWVIDVDGCLVRTHRAGGAGGAPIDGAADFLAWLRCHQRPFVVCTNASERPVREYAAHLRSIGLDVADSEMMTAATAAADHVAVRHPGSPVLVVGDRGLTEAMHERGVATMQSASSVTAAVVVGAAPTYATATLNAACLAIADHGAAFYVTVDSPWFHGGIGRSISASSAIASAIGFVTGRRAEVCGKPSPAIGEVLRRRLGGAGRRLAVVGDAATIEIPLAHQMGALGVLVMSGGTSLADIPRLAPMQRPHLQVADVGELVRLMQAAEP